ncbi:hypothetical protein J6Q66_09500 [bacterium]|nr:hypothetical protein [bacterium]
MKITAINNFNINFQNWKPNRFVSFKNNCADEVIISTQPNFEEISKNYFKNHKGKFDISDYKNLSQTEVKAIDENIPKTVKDAAEHTYAIGKCFKNYLDDKYGKDNYMFISIGTSPSGIGRVLEFSGVETKYLPLTGFRMSLDSLPKWINKYRNGVDHYIDFLDSQGINKDLPQKTNKEIIFADFVYSRSTLNNFEYLLEREMNFPLYDKNVHILNLEEELKHAFCREEQTDENKNMFNRFSKKYLLYGETAKYCGVPHLELQDFDKFDPTKIKRKPLQKQYNYEIIKRLDADGEIEENPQNRNSL